MSLIGSSIVTTKLASLQSEALGYLQFIDLDLPNLRSQFDRSASLVIMNLPYWSTDQAETFMTLRSTGYRGPIIALVNDPDTWKRTIARQIPERNLRQLTVLAKASEDFELPGLVRRLLAQQASNFRAHSRYDLVRHASLHLIQTEATLDCHVTNVSRGGACVEFIGPQQSLVTGSYVQIQISTDVDYEEQKLDGRIVWISSHEKYVGVEFLNAKIG
jgi:hypothetical protein